VIAGAERVKEETRRMWDRTGTTILEGYGATECSPVIAVNLPEASGPAPWDGSCPASTRASTRSRGFPKAAGSLSGARM
jgi:acyl-CoA synthetase (AMP-forming)/AMP-acid ligase II